MNSRQSSDRLLDKLPKMSEEQLRTVVESLRRKDHLWQQLFDALVDGVVVINSSLNVLYANRAAREMLRWDAHKLTTKQRLPNLLPVGELASLVTRFALEPKPFTGVEIELPGPEPRWISVSILAVEKDLDNQEETRFVLVMHDTTELHRVEAERQRAERAMTLATLAAGLAHEIKNPLNSLQIHAQLLQRALRERAKKIAQACRVEPSASVVRHHRGRNSTLEQCCESVPCSGSPDTSPLPTRKHQLSH
ncbi:MAG: hypothetical protein KatS3mg130_0152 [Candidatus Sumerlaea sp.]|nr:MAG: hypothetical protein KatS3mg130_0152 [Candidatus Sumerlaea sp.]